MASNNIGEELVHESYRNAMTFEMLNSCIENGTIKYKDMFIIEKALNEFCEASRKFNDVVMKCCIDNNMVNTFSIKL